MKSVIYDNVFKRNLLYNYGTKGVSIILGFAVTTLIIRYAGLSIFGVIAILGSLSGVFVNLITFRTNEALVAFVRRAEVDGDQGKAHLAVILGVALDLLLGALVFALFFYSVPLISEYFIDGYSDLHGIYMYAFVLPMLFIKGAPLGYMVACENFTFINYMNLLESAIYFLGILVYAIIDSDSNLGFEEIVISKVFSVAVPALIMFFYLLVVYSKKIYCHPVSWDEAREYFRFSAHTFLSSTLKSVSQQIDTVILAVFVSSSTVGIYNLFRQFISPLGIVVAPIAFQAYPRFVDAFSTGRHKDITGMIIHVNGILFRLYSVISILLFVILYYYSAWNRVGLDVIHFVLFGGMLVNAFILRLMWWSRPLANSIDPYLSVKANVLSFVLVWILMVPMVSGFGMAGTVVSHILISVSLLFYWRRVRHSRLVV